MSKSQKCPVCSDCMVWVDMGPSLQYWYCKACKKELSTLQIESTENYNQIDFGHPEETFEDYEEWRKRYTHP